MFVLSLAAMAQDKPRHATLSQQKMCADQAKKSFEEDNVKPEHALTWQFSSHYETNTNICYVMTWISTMDNSNKFTLSHYVYDAFEGREYASFIEIGSDVVECSVAPTPEENIKCKTDDDFLRLVYKQYGVAK